MGTLAVHLIGIVLAVAVLGGILVWLGWRRWLQSSQPTKMTANSLEKASTSRQSGRSSFFEREEHTRHKFVPPPIDVPPPAYTRKVAGPQDSESPLWSAPLPSPQIRICRESQVTMTEHEILDYHLYSGGIRSSTASSVRKPAFTTPPASAKEGATTNRASAGLLSAPDPGSKHNSAGTQSGWPRLSPGPKTSFPRSFRPGSFLSSRTSLSASVRFPGGSPPTSPGGPRFTFHQSLAPVDVPAPAEGNQRTVLNAAFLPLLPDELLLKAGDVVTLLAEFDDGWCAVARKALGSEEVGAVPSFVFEEAVNGYPPPRPMRSTSLKGVPGRNSGIERESSEQQRHWAEMFYRESLMSKSSTVA